MAFVHRKLWSFKPKQYGPWKVVHRSLMHNLETIYGIDSGRCSLAMPMWHPGDQRDYSKIVRNGLMVGDGIIFKDSLLNFSSAVDGTTDRINLGSITSSDPLSCFDSQELTIAAGLRYDGSTRNSFPRIVDKSSAGSGASGWYFGYLTTGNYLQFYTNGSIDNNFNGGAIGLLEDLEFHDIILTVKDNDQNLYDHGKLLESQVYGLTNFPSTTANAAIGNWNHSTDRNWLGDMKYILTFDKSLNKNQAGLLGEAPYQAWKSVPQKSIFILPDAGAAATLTGSAITGGVTESEIVTGGETIIITLTGDTWVATVGADNAITDALILGIISAQSETNGWNNVVRANMVFGDVARTSDTIVTITLAAEATYSITANETITITIPATSLTAASEIVATPTFDVTNEGAGFNAAWAGGSNVLMQPGVAA